MVLFEPVRHPNSYGWYIALGCVDIILTWSLLCAGGGERNTIALWAFERAGITGGALLKFTTVIVFLMICELVAKYRPPTGRLLARLAVVLALFPVVIGMQVLLEMLELGITVTPRFW